MLFIVTVPRRIVVVLVSEYLFKKNAVGLNSIIRLA